MLALWKRMMSLLSGLTVPFESSTATNPPALLSAPPPFGPIPDLTGSQFNRSWTLSSLASVAILQIPFIRTHPRAVAATGVVPAAAFSR